MDLFVVGTAYAASAEQGGSGLPQFDPSSFASQIFWAMVSFGVLLFLLNRYVLPIINKTLDERADSIKSEIVEAQDLREQAEKVLAEYQQQLADVHKEAAFILEHSRRDAIESHEKALREMDIELKRKKELFSSELDFAKRQAVKEVRGAAVELTMLATEKLVARHVDSDEAGRMVESSIEELRSLSN